MPQDNERRYFKKTYETAWEQTTVNRCVTKKIEYHSIVDVTTLKNNIVWRVNENQMILELCREIKQIVQELDTSTVEDKELVDAVEVYEYNGLVKLYVFVI